ncbi:LEAF RUST 10 DISEASE-RESISTANCE LOCUS RECEPTOR-LIKE PROTEIN KINASE-like 1.4 isoform X1 [Juglans microcarpa x Juglans regia]|uniref:LEAF RUST 10 DISEASE-RESISTANCE LOCUS RECEPTOR-LIKE PROTEIN KINASE-like 1.4 isoform X1 n=1 Tax=Juglans microcarpa x Juglans regia TaxID=2249226 RepID=UPI001B7E4EFF|nr:LEAF RUST 10 DISEASE-RESISTANCE LOCUS RECEPTOR-LIKE PROTEIN KINASE-like 1.4 isoform X1 [Juglans microcarpa x Juglans regia]
MHNHLFPAPATFFFIIIAITLVQFPVPSVHAVDDDQRYLNCSETFACAGISDIGYPFLGSNRPEYCGYPGFELNCNVDPPQLNVADMYYRVLEINSAARSLKVARVDYWNTTCPATYANTTIDRSSLFFHTSATTNLTLYYHCPATSSLLPTQPADGFSFICPGDASTGFTNYHSSNSLIAITLLGLCENNVKVPVTEAGTITTEYALKEAIDAGFTVGWNANNSMCDRCDGSGGRCGFNTSTNAFACHCKTGSFPSTCDESDGKKNGVSLGVGIGIGGAGIVGILLGFWMFSIRQRKKKRAEDAKIKELPTTPPSGKGIPDSSTNLSQSTPSYAHSKSDLEKGSTYFGAHIFSYAELEEATNNFDPSRELGDGGFGTVYYGKLHDGRVVAVKRLYENNFKRVEQFMNEVIILTRLRHKNLVTLYGCTSKRSQGLLLVYEYISNGTVADHLNGNKASTGSLTWPIRLSIAIESAEALNFLHQSDVIHRDVKTNNILLDENFCVKVADFGLSRLFPTDVTHVSTAPQGTPGYVDPEYYQCYQLTNKSDVYSFGVVLIELISSLPAVDTNRHRHDINLASMAINKIQNHSLHELVDPSLGFEKDDAVRRMTTSVAGLAFRCLQQERDMRPKMDEVLEVLKRIKNEEMGAEKAEVVDIRVDDVGQLKNIPPPLSPDSVVTGKWVSDSTTPNSF